MVELFLLMKMDTFGKRMEIIENNIGMKKLLLAIAAVFIITACNINDVFRILLSAT